MKILKNLEQDTLLVLILLLTNFGVTKITKEYYDVSFAYSQQYLPDLEHTPHMHFLTIFAILVNL